MPDVERNALERRFRSLIERYGRTLASDRRALLEDYRLADVARKVVGVGSVGTRCWIFLLLDRDGQDPLFLQAKEADTSVLAEHCGTSRYANQGERVVSGQRLMQAASDIFLGWERVDGIDGARCPGGCLAAERSWKRSPRGSAALSDARVSELRPLSRACPVGPSLLWQRAFGGDMPPVA